MARTRQKKLAQALVENSQKDKPDTLGEMLVNVGYSKNVAEAKPTEIIQSEGVQKELAALGFSEENANLVVGTILLNEKEKATDRLKAAELVYKVKGSFKSTDAPENTRVVNIFNNPTFELATRTYEQSLKAIISNENPQPVQAQTETSDPSAAGSSEPIPSGTGEAGSQA